MAPYGRRHGPWLLASLLVLSGCHRAGSDTPLATDGLMVGVPAALTAQLTSASGLAIAPLRGAVSLQLIALGADSFTSLRQQFTSATLVLQSPTLSPKPIVKELPASTFHDDGTSDALDVRINSSADWTSTLYFHDAGGRLVGTATQLNHLGASGGQVLQMSITANTQRPKLTGSADGGYVADGVVLKEQTLYLNSGIADALPGVDHIELAISGPAYGDGTQSVTIATFKPPELQNYTWSPLSPTDSYDPERLNTSLEALPLTLTTRAFDRFGTPVGTDSLTLSLVDAAHVTVAIGE